MPNPRSIHVLIADDHAIFRAAVRKLLESEPGFLVDGEAVDGAEAVTLAHRLQPDVLLLDLSMPGLKGLDTLRELRRSATTCRTIILTAHIDNAEIAEALRTGASGVLLKDSSTDILFQGIRAVMAGHHWVGRKRVSDLTQILGSTVPREAAPKRTFGLTPRELQVVSAVVAGNSNRGIAQRLSISQDTTKHHLSNIFDKLGVSNRLELALFAHNHQIIDSASDTTAASPRNGPSARGQANDR